MTLTRPPARALISRLGLRHFWHALAVLAGLEVGFAPASASADEAPSYALSWTHGEGVTGCATLSEVASSVEARLGHRVFASATDARRFIDARVESAPVGYRVVIAVYEASGEKSGERSISTADVRCRALDQPLSLMLALIIDPTLAATPSTNPPAQTLPPAPTSHPSQPAEPSAATGAAPAARSSNVDGSAQARARLAASNPGGRANLAGGAVELKLGFGILPGVAPGLATSLMIAASRHWAALVGATLWAPRRTSVDESRLGAGLEMSQATLALCGKSGESRLGVLGCAGVEPGVVVAQSYGLPSNGSRLRPALDFTVGARAAIKLGAEVSVLAGGDFFVPAVRSKFEATDAEGKASVIFQRSAYGGSASLGIAMNIFP